MVHPQTGQAIRGWYGRNRGLGRMPNFAKIAAPSVPHLHYIMREPQPRVSPRATGNDGLPAPPDVI